LNIGCLFWFFIQLLSDFFFLFWKEFSEIWSLLYADHYVKYPLLLSGFDYSTDFREIFKNPISWKSSSGSRVVTCERTDGSLTEMTKMIVAFSNFVNSSKKEMGLWDDHIVCVCVFVCVCVSIPISKLDQLTNFPETWYDHKVIGCHLIATSFKFHAGCDKDIADDRLVKRERH
jgi:hypothetical protein